MSESILILCMSDSGDYCSVPTKSVKDSSHILCGFYKRPGFSIYLFIFFSNVFCILFIKHREKMACIGNRDALSHPTANAKCMTWAAPDCNRPQHMWANEETRRFKGRTFYFGIIKHPQVLQQRGGQNGENLDHTVSGALATSLIYGFSRYDGALRGSLL